MTTARKISEIVSCVGAADWNRRLFDSLIPLPDGTSYNSYLVRGSGKTALVDTVDPTKTCIMMEQLHGVERVDYLIANHAEQDHSGSIPAILDRFPMATVLASPKCKGMLEDHLRVPAEKIRTVEDGETVSLGNRTLEFIHTPWVHWPETMCTYLVEDSVLFSCDFFGSHLATSDLFVTDEAAVYEAAKRYYAEIMMPFRSVIRRNMEKVQARNVSLIAPSHGPAYKNATFILDAYEDWTSENVRNEVVLPYISMHGSTEAMALHLTSALAARGVKVLLFDLATTDLGKLAIALVDAATIVIGTPTVHVGPHPAVFYATHLANALRPKLKHASVIGSYGWGSKAVEKISELIPQLKVEILPPVMVKGLPTETDYRKLEEMADTIAERHTKLGIA